MISDESSSDSETGRFKGHSEKKEKEQTRERSTKETTFNRSSQSRSQLNRDRREHASKISYNRRSRDRLSKYSPIRNRRHELQSDRRRRSPDRSKLSKGSRPRSRNKERSKSKTRIRSRSRSRRSVDRKKNYKTTDSKRDSKELPLNDKLPKEKPSPVDRRSSSIEYKGKKSVIHKPDPETATNKKPIISNINEQKIDSDTSDDPIQPASYYNMISTVNDVSKETSETDSSDDERLRAKLLNLEKELHTSRKKKHRKKHKKKTKKEKDCETVEVSSTTDIKGNKHVVDLIDQCEVTSTKVDKKETSEEGEISSDEVHSEGTPIRIDENDLRHKLKRSINTSNSERGESPDLRSKIGSKTDVCGPALPPHLEHKFNNPDVEGPALPPHLLKKDKSIGPQVSSKMREVLAEQIHLVEEPDEEGIGPLPEGSKDQWTEAHQLLEERALNIKIKKLDGHTDANADIKKREEWMLELPEAKAKIIGLEARSFRAKEGPDMSDRSSWTDTPEDKAKKAAGMTVENSSVTLKAEAHNKYIEARDNEQEQSARSHKKKHKRDESLLEIHQKKLKKKKKKEDKYEDKKERRPFSRDVDLQVNRFDDAQKQAIIKKAQHLDTRFSRGEAKYL